MQQQKNVDEGSSRIDWGTPLSKLPIDLGQYLPLIFDMTGDDYGTRSTNRQLLMALGDVIHDISSFIDEHPGGRALLNKFWCLIEHIRDRRSSKSCLHQKV